MTSPETLLHTLPSNTLFLKNLRGLLSAADQGPKMSTNLSEKLVGKKTLVRMICLFSRKIIWTKGNDTNVMSRSGRSDSALVFFISSTSWSPP